MLPLDNHQQVGRVDIFMVGAFQVINTYIDQRHWIDQKLDMQVCIKLACVGSCIGLVEKDSESDSWELQLSVTRHDAVKSALTILLPLSLQEKTSSSAFVIDLFMISIRMSTFEFRSDSNSYFPIGPCEYGGPLQALMAGDANAGRFTSFSSYRPDL